MAIGQSVQVQNICKDFGSFRALNDVCLEAKAGEFLTILGSSGCGKTTLLKIVAGFLGATAGSILINGEDVAEEKAYERNIGMLFQNYALFPHMTVAENIAYPLKLRKVEKTERNQRVGDMIELIQLEGLEKRYPKQLSGGQQQRVALARALVYNPPLLLLDEPLGALDKNLRHEMQFEIKRIQRELGITTISVTHDQEEALTMSDKVCIINHGVVQQCSTPEKIYGEPKNKFVAEFMGSTNLIPGIVENCCVRDGCIETTVKTKLSDEPFIIREPGTNIMFRMKHVLLAIRLEYIHLMKDRPGHVNSFRGKVKGSVYLGDCVRLAVETQNGRVIEVKLSNEACRRYADKEELEFFFNPDCATTIYERERNTMLTWDDVK